MAKKGKNKKPKAASNPRFQKIPRAVDLQQQIGTKPFCWRVTELDWDGPWGWGNVSLDVLLKVIVPKLHDYESMTWAAVDGPSGCHFVNNEDLCPEAQGRLRQLEKDEQGALFSVRIQGKLRVWGIRDLAILRVLWFDPKHEVCPSKKKGTKKFAQSVRICVDMYAMRVYTDFSLIAPVMAPPPDPQGNEARRSP